MTLEEARALVQEWKDAQPDAPPSAVDVLLAILDKLLGE